MKSGRVINCLGVLPDPVEQRLAHGLAPVEPIGTLDAEEMPVGPFQNELTGNVLPDLIHARVMQAPITFYGQFAVVENQAEVYPVFTNFHLGEKKIPQPMFKEEPAYAALKVSGKGVHFFQKGRKALGGYILGAQFVALTLIIIQQSLTVTGRIHQGYCFRMYGVEYH